MNWRPFSQLRLSIFHHLIGLVFITVVPVMLFASGLVMYLADQRAQALETNIMGTTRALETAVNETIVAVISSLRILGEAEGFEADTVQLLHKRLRQFVNNQPDWDHISFVDTRGVQIFHTHYAFGTKLPNLTEESYFNKMILSEQTVVSGYKADSDVITVAVPVIRDGIMIYGLIGAVKLDTFSKLLVAQNLPRSWTAAILDNDLNYIARSKNSAYYIGKKVSEKIALRSRSEGNSGFSYANNSGSESFVSVANSPLTNWRIFLRVPDDGHLFTSWKTILYIILGGSLLLGLSILVALLLARIISSPLKILTQSAKALEKGLPVKPIRTSLTEVLEVNQAMQSASVTRNENEVRIHEAIKHRDTFLSVASHELKTPISTLKLQFQMLDRMRKRNNNILTPADLEKPFQRVHGQVERLTSLVDDLLDVARISSGKMTYHPETFDLIPFLEDLIQQHDHTIDLRGPFSLYVHLDRHRLEQIFVNLITNAIKYGNKQKIIVSTGEENGTTFIEVKDHGIGITEENLTRIFERYQRVGENRGISGLGLGLWIVKRILEGFGGAIHVTSQHGIGSTFRVTLPIFAGSYLSPLIYQSGNATTAAST